MQARKKTVIFIEPAAGNVDASHQRALLYQYAKLHDIEIDTVYGERAPLAGASGHADQGQVLNDIKEGGVGLLLVLEEVRHAIPKEVLDAAREAGTAIKFVDAQQDRGLSQPV